MSEREDAISLANTILDQLGRDPDDDLSVLSRQLLRTNEALQAVRQGELLEEYYTAMNHAYEAMRQAIKASNLSQDDISTKLGVDKALISRRLRGDENLTLKTLSFMATAIGCRLDVRFVSFSELGRPIEEAGLPADTATAAGEGAGLTPKISPPKEDS